MKNVCSLKDVHLTWHKKARGKGERERERGEKITAVMSAPRRRQQYKASLSGKGSGLLRRRREESQAVSKTKRELVLRTKRFKYSSSQNQNQNQQQQKLEEDEEEEAEEADDWRQVIGTLVNELRSVQLSRSQGGHSSSIEANGVVVKKQRELEYLRRLRKAVSSSYANAAVLEEAVRCGCVQVVAPYLHGGADPELALESAWICSNVATNTADQQAFEQLLQVTHLLLMHVEASSNDVVAEQCCTCIGNIAAESETVRDTLLRQNAMQSLYKMFLKGLKGQAIGVTAAWAISNLVRGSFSRSLEILASFPDVEKALVQAFCGENRMLAIEVAWILTYLSAGPSEHLAKVVNQDLVSVLIEKLGAWVAVDFESLDDDSVMLLVPVLRTFGNICCEGSDAARLQIIQNPAQTRQALAVVCACLRSRRRLLQKDAAFLLSNLTALRGPECVQLVKSTPNLVPALYALLNSAMFDIRKEIAYSVANICAGGGGMDGDELALKDSTAHGSFRAFLELIETRDPEVVRLALQFFEMALRVLPESISLLEESNNGMELIENVQYTSRNQELSRMASYIVDTHFAEVYDNCM